LHGPAHGFAERFGSVERPVGVAQHLAGEEDDVGLAFGDDFVGLLRFGDEADCGGGDACFFADAFGEGDLEGGAGGNFGMRHKAAGGDIDEIDAVFAEMAGELYGFVGRPPTFGPVGGGDADQEWQVVGPSGAYGIGDLERETGTVLEAAAVLVGALIGKR